MEVEGGGILLEKDNVTEWVETIKRLFSDENYFNTQSEKAKRFIKTSYSQEEIVNKAKDLIDSIVKN